MPHLREREPALRLRDKEPKEKREERKGWSCGLGKSQRGRYLLIKKNAKRGPFRAEGQNNNAQDLEKGVNAKTT